LEDNFTLEGNVKENKVRIAFFSDWHTLPLTLLEKALDRLAPFDLIVFAGDGLRRFIPEPNIPVQLERDARRRCGTEISNLFSVPNPEEILELLSAELGPPNCVPVFSRGIWSFWRILNLFRTFESNFLSHLSTKANYGLVAVAGNADYEEERYILNAPGLTNIHEMAIDINSFGFIGIEGSISHNRSGIIVNNRGLNFPDDNVYSHLEKQYIGLPVSHENIVLVSHTPPAGYLDLSIRFGDEEGLGSPSLTEFIRDKQPALVLCGHCHHSGGRTDKIGKTIIVNAASDDHNIKHARIAVIELEPDKPINVEWPLMKGIYNIPYIAEKRAEKLINAGVLLVDDLFSAEDSIILNAFNGQKRHLERIRALERGLQNNCIVWLSGRSLMIPEKLLFYDVETGIQSTQEAWMISVVSSSDKQLKQWAVPKRLKRSRKKMYSEFLDFIAQYPDHQLCAWTNNKFDFYAINHGMKACSSGLMEKWSAYFNNHFDLLKELNACVVFPVFDRSLKTVASWCGYSDNNNTIGMNGREVGLMYDNYIMKGTDLDIQKIQDYNRHDVMMMAFIVDWVKKQPKPVNQ